MMRQLRGPGGVIVVCVALIFFLLCSAGYTQWAIHQYGSQSCSELRILATTGGATTPYDRTIRGEYKKLFELRCG